MNTKERSRVAEEGTSTQQLDHSEMEPVNPAVVFASPSHQAEEREYQRTRFHSTKQPSGQLRRSSRQASRTVNRGLEERVNPFSRRRRSLTAAERDDVQGESSEEGDVPEQRSRRTTEVTERRARNSLNESHIPNNTLAASLAAREKVPIPEGMLTH
jgi:hypothetical protein